MLCCRLQLSLPPRQPIDVCSIQPQHSFNQASTVVRPRHDCSRTQATSLDLCLALYYQLCCGLGCIIHIFSVRNHAISANTYCGLTHCVRSPRSLIGGDLHWIWEPYSLYESVDLVSWELSSPSSLSELINNDSGFCRCMALSTISSMKAFLQPKVSLSADIAGAYLFWLPQATMNIIEIIINVRPQSPTPVILHLNN